MTETPATSEGGSTPEDQLEVKRRRAALLRESLSTTVELIGIFLLGAGFWMLRPWLGLVVLGAALTVFAIGLGRTPSWQEPHSKRAT